MAKTAGCGAVLRRGSSGPPDLCQQGKAGFGVVPCHGPSHDGVKSRLDPGSDRGLDWSLEGDDHPGFFSVAGSFSFQHVVSPLHSLGQFPAV